jgi:hypothetical protein
MPVAKKPKPSMTAPRGERAAGIYSGAIITPRARETQIALIN